MRIVSRLAYLADRLAGEAHGIVEDERVLAEGALVEVPRGMNGNKRPIAIVEHAVVVVVMVLGPILRQRMCRSVRSLSAMWITTKFRATLCHWRFIRAITKRPFPVCVSRVRCILRRCNICLLSDTGLGA